MTDLAIRVDSASFGRLLRGARDFDRSLYLQARRRFRAAAKPVVADVKQELLKGGPSKTGLRQGLADGTRASISTGKRAGVTITTSPSRLPAGKRPMVKAWNRSTFRHPVGGNPDVWVTQAGNPYFDSVILPHRYEFQRALLQALQDAIRVMEAAT